MMILKKMMIFYYMTLIFIQFRIDLFIYLFFLCNIVFNPHGNHIKWNGDPHFIYLFFSSKYFFKIFLIIIIIFLL